MNIIDFHTHPFLSAKNNSCFYNNIVSADNFKELVTNSGITQICGSVIFKTEDFNQIKNLNKEALNLKKQWGDFYIPGIHIHPDFLEESIEELSTYSSKGVKLVGELVPYYHGWDKYYDENMHVIMEEIDSLNMVVSLHTDEKTNMDNLEMAVKKFPNITFVGAHPQQKEYLQRHISLLKKYDNYYLDLSGKGLNRFGMVTFLVNKCGKDKILFGTDFPICNPKMYVQAVLYENLKTDELEAIFYNNAKRILEL